MRECLALGTEDKISRKDDDKHAGESGEKGLGHVFGGPPFEIAADEHQRDGDKHSDVGNHLAGGKGGGVDNAAVAHGQTYDIQHHHGTYLVDKRPSFGKKHHPQWHCEKV